MIAACGSTPDAPLVTHISTGYQHRLENPGILELVMIEAQSGEHLGEDDIVRFQDHYGRA